MAIGIESPNTISQLTPILAAIGTALTAIIAATKYFSKKEKMTNIREVFKTTIQGLSSQNEPEKLANAILLRRFFDKKSELYVDSTSRYINYQMNKIRVFFNLQKKYIDIDYSFEIATINVIAAILRNEKIGHFQKILIDGLAYANSLRNADLQKINAQYCNLGRKDEKIINLNNADFFQANLSAGRIEKATAKKTVFLQAKLINTVFVNVEFNETNFYGADLDGAKFKQCKFIDVDFSNCINIDKADFSKCDIQPTLNTSNSTEQKKIFISRPSSLTIDQSKYYEQVLRTVKSQGFISDEIKKEDYVAYAQLEHIKGSISQCAGVILFDFADIKITTGVRRDQTQDCTQLENYSISSSWVQIEAGMSIMANKPLLILHDCLLNDGVFDKQIDSLNIDRLDIDLEKYNESKTTKTLVLWLEKLI